MSRELFLKMSEEHYFRIPENVRQCYLTEKIYAQSDDDFHKLMEVPEYKKAYENHKSAKKELEDIKYKIREEWRTTSPIKK